TVADGVDAPKEVHKGTFWNCPKEGHRARQRPIEAVQGVFEKKQCAPSTSVGLKSRKELNRIRPIVVKITALF
ncbi:hypothetical protein ILUMI_09983, partial [Ignelater luminosus]